MLAQQKKNAKICQRKAANAVGPSVVRKALIQVFLKKKTANQFGWPANFFGWLIIFVSSFFNDEKIYMYRTVLSLLKHFSGESYFSINFLL